MWIKLRRFGGNFEYSSPIDCARLLALEFAVPDSPKF
ncbi:hypothetical protein LSS_22335 [Leptospira santarosai serovar Shermani str. LT 821]|uniref:Uncharacterized protein n=1 Tax=Leptospira santarosai serovar Shermani str. LT 821 TaxID=758847 RepID=A0A097ESV4_9LEPT|nr:hypothetical protein LSS_22335 [Leptospira santarosai serovar Shermani str. LT 821]